MTMPNFLIIGAGKSGTTSLYHYLRQHPEVYMSPMKEPKFFCFEGESPNFRGPGDDVEINRKCVTTVDAYSALFGGVADEKAVGEASSMYLYLPKSPGRIRHHLPDARLIAVLRNPVERAYSSYLHCVRDRGEPLGDFAEALREEEDRINKGWGPLWHYKTAGFYFAQLRRYFDTFERRRIRIYLYEDLKYDAAGVLEDIFGFLGVDDSYAPDISLRHNVSGVPRSRILHALLNKPNPIKTAFKPLVPAGPRKVLNHKITGRNLVRPQLSPDVRRELTEAYAGDILRVQDLIQRDLSKWLEG
ncbi:MAG: sulfotransferase [Rubrobacteraceae bacterium]|nr:sulfotransferase [Rubrobacteraceae bacterium]